MSDDDGLEVIQINMKRLTPREISTIEEHTGCNANKWQSDECPAGKFAQALAYVALRRRNPSEDKKALWERANDTVIEAEDEAVPNGSESDS